MDRGGRAPSGGHIPPVASALGFSSWSLRVQTGQGTFRTLRGRGAAGKPGGRREGRGFVRRPGGARGPEGRGSPPPARGGKREHLSGRSQNACPGVARQQPFSPVAGRRVTMATAPRRALRVFKEQARATAGCRKAAFRATAISPPATPPLSPPPSSRRQVSGLQGGPNSPEQPRFWGWSGCRRCGAGSRAPGGREGRDAVQCCSFPRQYCTRPGLRPPRPPGLPLAPSGPAPAFLALDPDDLRDWSVAAATVSKWGWEDFSHLGASPLSFTYPSPAPSFLHPAPHSAKVP